MLQIRDKNLKIKKLSKEQLIISIDRLTRFKEPEIKYLRVFKEIISSNLIEPKLKKSELDEMDYSKLTELAADIINYSLNISDNDLAINQKIYDYENKIFNLNENTKKLLKNKINYKEIIKLLPDDTAPNLKFLKAMNSNNDIKKLRRIENFCFPVEKLILCEGITEEILLPEFAKLCDYNFNENGVYIISAGGKNQVVKYFYRFVQSLKIPIFVLLDNDAKENLREIQPKLRNIDRIHLLRSGEFEDMLPDSLIVKTLEYATKNISIAPIEGIQDYKSKVEFLEEFFRHRGLHEFKKAEFAQLVKENIKTSSDISQEVKDIIKEIKGTKVPLKNGV